MKIKYWFTPTLFAYKELSPEAFISDTTAVEEYLQQIDRAGEIFIILPSKSDPSKISRMLSLIKSRTPAHILMFIKMLRLPTWKE